MKAHAGRGRCRVSVWWGAAALVGSLALSPGVALAAEGDEAASAAPNEEAPKLEQAVKLMGELNYSEAKKVLLSVVESGRATVDQLSKAYFGIGEADAALGNDIEATDSFYLALMIQPATLFPAGGSPKIRERLDEARSRVTEVGALEASARVAGGALDVQLHNDPLQLVKVIEVSMTRAGGDVGKATLDRKAPRVQVDPDVQEIRVVLRDEAGNELKVMVVDPAAKPDAATPAAPGGSPTIIWQSWGLWAGVAGALALGGTYFVIESGKLSDDLDAAKGEEQPNQPLIDNLQDRKDRVGLYGIVGLSLAGAAAATAGALLFLTDDASAPASEAAASGQARLSPSFGPQHIGAEFSLRF